MCFVGTYMLFGGEIGLTEFLSIIIIGTKIISPLLTWIRYTAVLRMHYVSATRIDKVMREKELTGDKIIKNMDDIEFKNVSFSGYCLRARAVLLSSTTGPALSVSQITCLVSGRVPRPGHVIKLSIFTLKIVQL